MNLQLRISLGLAVLWLAGCGSVPPARSPAPNEQAGQGPVSARPAFSPTVQRLVNESRLLEPLARSNITRHFLAATESLPAIAPRTAYINEKTREYFSTAARDALPEARKNALSPVQFDEYRYYYTKGGSPLAYVRALEFAADENFKDLAGKRILDFGYGSIGQLRLLASLGAKVTGIDPDGYLAALYTERSDQGAVALAPMASGFRRQSGSVTLAHGLWPKDPKIVEQVGRGYDLILSKNTLKRGYIKPERKVDDKRQLIDLGVNDQVFLSAIYNALAPGGKLVIYNLYPKPSDPKEKFRPMADGRSPYSREQFERAGLKVVALDAEDHVNARKMGRLLGWDKNQAGETVDNLESNLFALVTVVFRP